MTATTRAGNQWWLLQNGSPAGPFSQNDVTRMLGDRQLTLDALACPVGSKDWLPLRDWNGSASSERATDSTAKETANVAKEAPHSPIPPSEPRTLAAVPDMARWLCIYALFVGPTLWAINKLSCLTAPPIFLEESPFFGLELLFNLADLVVTLGISVVLFVGALALQNRRRMGKTLLAIGLAVDLGWLAVGSATLITLFAAAASEPGVEHVNWTEAGSIQIAVVLCGLGLAATIFEVVALVWLMTKGRRIQLPS